jgi:hypothetical protein
VTGVSELKEWMEEHPDFGMDMELLEDRGVLLTPPHWSYVSKRPAALANDNADATSLEDHRQAVRKYARMLAERQHIMEHALDAAAYVSVASMSNDPAERLRDALRALPKDGRADVPRIQSLPDLPLLLKDGRTREWADALRERNQGVVNSQVVPIWTEVEERSWATWRKRLQQYRGGGRRRFDVDLDDLLLRTRRAGPAALFSNDLDQMTLREWTEALLAAVRRAEERSALKIPDWVEGVVREELIMAPKLLLILGESTTSPTAQWLPSKRHSSLWIERTRWFEYYDALRLGVPDSLPAVRRYVAVEVSGDPDALTQAVRRDVSMAFGSPPALPVGRDLSFAYLGREKLPTQATPVVPYVENAKGVDETIVRLDLLRPGQSASRGLGKVARPRLRQK